jgi:hypothetical protein
VTAKREQILSLVDQLKVLMQRFGEPIDSPKLKLLQLISANKIDNPHVIKIYHECLLFLAAYPDNEQILRTAESELKRVGLILKEISFLKNESKQNQLYATGMVHTKMICRFSFDLVKWLCEKYPLQIELYSCDADKEQMQNVMRLLMSATQHELIDGDHHLNILKWIKLSKGKNKITNLSWLINRFVAIECDDEIRESLFASLKVFVSITLNEQMHSRTDARTIAGNIFCHNSDLIKKVNPSAIINEPILKPKKLTYTEKEHLVTVAKMSLCSLLRETDPVTYADANATEYFDLGRGITVALYTMNVRRRLPLESYIGYMAFKNGLPVAYGGGWIYNHRSKIGINIYAPFRGGESSYLFCQLLRLYAQLFNVNCFVAEPYQIGKHNSDGMKSGAFWFYYKLGFRPFQKDLLEIANNEFEKISADKKYRTSKSILQKLANANMQLIVNENKQSEDYFDVAALSKAQIKYEAEKFGGDRLKSEKSNFNYLIKTLGIKDYSKWNVSEQYAFKRMNGLIAMINDLEKWNKKEKTELVKTLRSKGLLNEMRFIKNLQQHKKLTSSWFDIATHNKLKT